MSPVSAQIADLIRHYDAHMAMGKITTSSLEAKAHYALAARSWAMAQQLIAREATDD